MAPDVNRTVRVIVADDVYGRSSPQPAEAIVCTATLDGRALRRVKVASLQTIAVVLSACSGPQSALDPAGRGAEDLESLFWWMTAGTVAVWLAVFGLAVYAARVDPEAGRRGATLMIIGGGAVVPTIVLCGLLVYGLRMMPPLLAAPPPGSLRIAVSGEQWWWRVKYHPAEGGELELANEIRLPVGEPVELELESPDVIHSFWIPTLGGKMDMIPGRRTRLTLQPTRTGVFRGVCAEYCGASHAFMAFSVVVMEKREYSRWLRKPASSSPPTTPPPTSSA